MKKDRRAFLKSSSLAALALSDAGPASAMSRTAREQQDKKWPLTEGPHTPKMVLSCPVNADVKAMRKLTYNGPSAPFFAGPCNRRISRDNHSIVYFLQ